MQKYLYLLLDLISFIFPFLFSFEKRWLHFISRWKAIFAGLATMAVFFLIWDIIFTAKGVWGFNQEYLVGIYWNDLPLEEYLFFFMIGYSCLFLYESMFRIIPISNQIKYFRFLFILWAGINLVVALLYSERAYTLSSLGLNALGILLVAFGYKDFPWNKFFLGYLISFIPFTLVNGILTGSFTDNPVVWYNHNENLNIRLGTIPIEDSQYMMLMMLISTSIYEKCITRFKPAQP